MYRDPAAPGSVAAAIARDTKTAATPLN